MTRGRCAIAADGATAPTPATVCQECDQSRDVPFFRIVEGGARRLRQGLAKATELLRAGGSRDRQPETAVAQRIGSGDGLPGAGGRQAGAGLEVEAGEVGRPREA